MKRRDLYRVRDCTVFAADFAAYYRAYPAWGRFHVVMDDGNWADRFVDLGGDTEQEAWLAFILWMCTQTQRRKLRRLAERQAVGQR